MCKESYINDLFCQAVDQLIAKKILNKGAHAAHKLDMSYDIYKNLRSNRTQFTEEQWHNFLDLVKRLDPEWTYKWLIQELIK